MTRTRLLVFAKAPQAGSVKTRLIPALGTEGAAALAKHMLAHTLSQALAAGTGPVELCMSPNPSDPAWGNIKVPDAVAQSAQGDGDLGQRMQRAFMRLTYPQTFSPQSWRGLSSTPERDNALQCDGVLLLGTDCPALDATLMRAAARGLSRHDAVLIPAHDGGYVLIGLKAPCPKLFECMPWSTAGVAMETLGRMAGMGLSVWKGPTLHDIDEPSDLHHLGALPLPPNVQAT